jgi:hypothetical protein
MDGNEEEMEGHKPDSEVPRKGTQLKGEEAREVSGEKGSRKPR